MERYLAESKNYKVTSEYEMVFLHFKAEPQRKPILIGDFYGDPECAIISRDEKFVVMAGCGIIIYRLQDPFKEFKYDSKKRQDQFTEFYRKEPNVWWTNGLHQTTTDMDWKFFRFVAANKDGEFIYKMDSTTFEVERINILPNI